MAQPPTHPFGQGVPSGDSFPRCVDVMPDGALARSHLFKLEKWKDTQEVQAGAPAGSGHHSDGQL